MLVDEDDLAMSEVIGDFTHSPLPSTFFRGSTPIDAIWATKDIHITGACMMPCGYGVGDHRLLVIDFTLQSIIGSSPRKVIRPAARRLNTRIPQVLQKYTTNLETLFTRHKVVERLEHLSRPSPHKSAADVEEALQRLDTESANLMRAAEKRCRKLKSGLIPFSPDAVKWIRRKIVLSSIVAFKKGARKNQGNLVRLARRAGIDRPLSMSLLEATTKLQICSAKCDVLRKTGWLIRRQHLRDRCDEARSREDTVALNRILAIIKREQDKAFWSRLRYKTGKKRGRSVSSVQVERDQGGIIEHTTQESVQSAIFREVHQK